MVHRQRLGHEVGLVKLAHPQEKVVVLDGGERRVEEPHPGEHLAADDRVLGPAVDHVLREHKRRQITPMRGRRDRNLIGLIHALQPAVHQPDFLGQRLEQGHLF